MKFKKIFLGVFALMCCFVFTVASSEQMQAVFELPNTYYIQRGENCQLDGINSQNLSIRGDSVEVVSSTDPSIKGKDNVKIVGKAGGVSKISVSMMGLPVKTVDVVVKEQKRLIPGGQAIGVTLQTQGALVVGTSDVVSKDGSKGNPAHIAGIKSGDVIVSVNGVDIQNSAHLSMLINDVKGDVTIGILDEGITKASVITPRADASDGKLRLGLWVRDSTAGVGTLTFFDPDTNTYGALGHAITDIDTRSKLLIKEGEIYQSKIIDVTQGSRGEPGELKGSFINSKPIGSIEKNTSFGIFGSAKEKLQNDLYPDGILVASIDQVHTGDAQILSTVDGEGIKRFKCKIIKMQNQTTPTQRGMVVQITDERLLNATGGIVQGMSGSPILQDGLLVGALTHVLVNDPSKGYGMFVQWMLDA